MIELRRVTSPRQYRQSLERVIVNSSIHIDVRHVRTLAQNDRYTVFLARNLIFYNFSGLYRAVQSLLSRESTKSDFKKRAVLPWSVYRISINTNWLVRLSYDNTNRLRRAFPRNTNPEVNIVPELARALY